MSIHRPPARQSTPTFKAIAPPRHLFRVSILGSGLVLLTVAWTVAWAGPEPLRWHTFFPLWLGYILTVDGLNLRLSGTSFLSRSPGTFARMFLVSIPLWWIYEALNVRLNNWTYHLPVDYPPLIFAILASISFSTVVPALFETATLYRSLSAPWIPIHTARWPLHRRALVGTALAGLFMLTLVVLVPRQAFPLTWLALFFLLDPINALAGRPSLIAQAAAGRWATILSLCCAGITCGLLWEMWNYWSMPKWTYDIPYVDVLRIFEMPILGYGGYLPFALEVYALVSLASGWVPSLRQVLLDPGPAPAAPRRD